MTRAAARRFAVERMELNLAELLRYAIGYTRTVDNEWNRVTAQTELTKIARKYSRSVDAVRRS